MRTAADWYTALKKKSHLFEGSHNVYTPQKLVEEILKMITLADQKILVMFNLEFVVSLLHTYNVPPENITLLSDHENKILIAEDAGINYITKLETDMKFDVVVGNPPYQEHREHGKKVTGNGALWVKFITQALELVKDDGYVSLITPDSWTSPTYDLMGSRESILNDYFKKYNLEHVDFDVKKYFKNVGIDPCYFIVKKSNDYTNTSINTPNGKFDINLENMSFIPKDLNPLSLSIHSKVLSNSENARLFKMRWKSIIKSINVQNDKDDVFKYPFIDAHSHKPVRWASSLDPDASKRKVLVTYVGKYQCIVDDNGELGAKQAVSVLFLNDNEKGEYADNFFNSKLIHFIMNSNRWTQYILSQILNFIPIIDFTQDWDDTKIYNYFNFSQEEIDYIVANN
jgi:Eco57I restriction-modification methylase/Protein of unknown function (DUF1493)